MTPDEVEAPRGALDTTHDVVNVDDLRKLARDIVVQAVDHHTGKVRAAALIAADALVHYVNLITDGSDG